jgi:ATP-dependent RNA helicase RhlB
MKRLAKKIGGWLKNLGSRRKKVPAPLSVPPRSSPPAQQQPRRPARDGHRVQRPRAPRPSGTHRPHEEKRRPGRAWSVKEFVVPPAEGRIRFHDLNLPDEVMRAIADLKFQYCTPIQAALIPATLQGKDATGQAQTGTGKTAAFLITIFTTFLRSPIDPADRKPGVPRALVLAPTRELVLQIEKDAHLLSRHFRCTTLALFGGMDYQKQKHRLASRRTDLVVATPGRLLDFMNQRLVDLRKVEILVIDEADRMLDMGFIPDVRRIVHSTPKKGDRQTMFFSATLTGDVNRLASSWTHDPVVVVIDPERIAVDSVRQHVYITTMSEKFALMYNIITRQNLDRVIVFTNRKDEAHRVAHKLKAYGVSSGLLSGNVTQHQRIRTLEEFRSGKFRVLVATDVAARGLHIEGVSHVINYNLPLDPEDFVHRVGRTGRAGLTGDGISFADEEDGLQIPAIENFIRRKLETMYPPEDLLKPLPAIAIPDLPKEQPPRDHRHQHRRHRGRRRPRGSS